MPGQTIQLSIIDFGSELYKRQNGSVSPPIYGYIRDGQEKIEIRGSIQRNVELYSSESSQIQLEFLPLSEQRKYGFLIQFKSMFPQFKTLLRINEITLCM